MTLKYKITKTTELNSEAIIKNILSVIENRKYGILDVTNNSVSFDDYSGGLVWNWEYAKRMKSGKFEIIKNENSNIVVFEYYPIPVSEFIWAGIISLIFIVAGIINKNYFVGFISCLFLGQLIFKHYNLKGVAIEMLTQVVG